MRLLSRNNYIYVFSSYISASLSGYNLRLGGGAFGSLSRILCSNCYLRLIGNVGSLNTEEYIFFKRNMALSDNYFNVMSPAPELPNACL